MSYRRLDLLYFHFIHSYLKFSLWPSGKCVKSSTPKNTVLYYSHRGQTHPSGFVTSVKSWFQSICFFFTHTSSSIPPLNEDLLLFLFQPTRTHSSFQDLVQNANTFQALFSTYLPVTPSRWHNCTSFWQEPSPQLPSSVALYVFEFHSKFHLPSTYNFNYITGLLISAAFCRWRSYRKKCRQKW